MVCLCVGCGVCIGICPVRAIKRNQMKGISTVCFDYSKCNSCGLCIKLCPAFQYLSSKDIPLSKKLDIPLENIAAVGNSCFDIPMLENCGIAIAFNPHDECIKNIADYIIEIKDLTKIVKYIKKYI